MCEHHPYAKNHYLLSLRMNNTLGEYGVNIDCSGMRCFFGEGFYGPEEDATRFLLEHLADGLKLMYDAGKLGAPGALIPPLRKPGESVPEGSKAIKTVIEVLIDEREQCREDDSNDIPRDAEEVVVGFHASIPLMGESFYDVCSLSHVWEHKTPEQARHESDKFHKIFCQKSLYKLKADLDCEILRSIRRGERIAEVEIPKPIDGGALLDLCDSITRRGWFARVDRHTILVHWGTHTS